MLKYLKVFLCKPHIRIVFGLKGNLKIRENKNSKSKISEEFAILNKMNDQTENTKKYQKQTKRRKEKKHAQRR